MYQDLQHAEDSKNSSRRVKSQDFQQLQASSRVQSNSNFSPNM